MIQQICTWRRCCCSAHRGLKWNYIHGCALRPCGILTAKNASVKSVHFVTAHHVQPAGTPPPITTIQGTVCTPIWAAKRRLYNTDPTRPSTFRSSKLNRISIEFGTWWSSPKQLTVDTRLGVCTGHGKLHSGQDRHCIMPTAH